MSAELVRSIKGLEGLNYSQIAEWFNFALMIDNPDPQSQVPDPVTIPELLTLTSPERAVTLTAIPMYRDAIKSYNTGAFEDALAYINVLHQSKTITDEEYRAVIKELSKTIPNPYYQEQVASSPRYLEYGFTSPITAEQVQGWFNA
jgi:hypothetical protein